MPIPAALKQTVDEEFAAYCERRIPLRVRDKVRLVHQWKGSRVTLIEQRPKWNNPAVWVPLGRFPAI